MRTFVKRLLGIGAAAMIVVAASGCSDSTTEPKETPPYPNADILVSGETLQANLDVANQVIVDTRKIEEYDAGHIPNAISLPITAGGGLFDIGGTDPLTKTDLKPAAEIALVLGNAGLTEVTRVVVYSNEIDTAAGRMFWMLEYLGATEVVMLNGGFAKWTADGRPTSTTPNTLPATIFTPSVVASALVTKADVLAHYDDTAHYVIVDSRSYADWQASHIPHSVNILTTEVVNADYTMKTQIELEALFTSRSISPDKKIYTHCYIGYRSSQGYFYFRLMGYDVSHYDGSWTEWNADASTPKESA